MINFNFNHWRSDPSTTEDLFFVVGSGGQGEENSKTEVVYGNEVRVEAGKSQSKAWKIRNF